MEENTIYNPLVSIVVITYNSSQFVLETLESAKAQTYKNIELIVSDDCSMDDTVEVCKNWLENNNDRFVRSQIIRTNKNSGVPANCNRGVSASRGEWIKIIAGDDLLLSSGVEDYIKSIRNNDVGVIVSLYRTFKNIGNKQMLLDIYPRKQVINKFFNKSSAEQWKLMVRENYSFVLGLFYKRVLIKKAGGYDEKYRLLEDLPFQINLLSHGYKFYFLDKITTLYRQSEGSITKSKFKKFPFNPEFIENQNMVYKDMLREHLPVNLQLLGDYKYWAYQFIIKNKIYSARIIKILLKWPLYISPMNYWKKIFNRKT